MNTELCPDCGKELNEASDHVQDWMCLHQYGKYRVYYHPSTNDTVAQTHIGLKKPWQPIGHSIIKLDGLVLMSEERIERILLLK
jgi:hypothetical protein